MSSVTLYCSSTLVHTLLSYRLNTSSEESEKMEISNCSKVLFSDRPSAKRVATSTEVNGKRSLSAFCCVSDGRQSPSEVDLAKEGEGYLE